MNSGFVSPIGPKIGSSWSAKPIASTATPQDSPKAIRKNGTTVLTVIGLRGVATKVCVDISALLRVLRTLYE